MLKDGTRSNGKYPVICHLLLILGPKMKILQIWWKLAH